MLIVFPGVGTVGYWSEDVRLFNVNAVSYVLLHIVSLIVTLSGRACQAYTA